MKKYVLLVIYYLFGQICQAEKTFFRKGPYKDLIDGKQPPENRVAASDSRPARNTTR